MPCTCSTYTLGVLLSVITRFEDWLSRWRAAAAVFTAIAVVISMSMLPMSLVVSPVPTVFLSTTTSMLLPMPPKPYCKPTFSGCRSQETFQFLPSSFLQALPLTTTATATTPITQLKQRTIALTGFKWHSTHPFIPFTNCKPFLPWHMQTKY
jgi:hypothetical protein